MSDAVKDAWLNAREDRLGARGEALAWALRKAWYAQGNSDYGMLKFVADNVQKPDGSRPWPEALKALFSRIDDDEDNWYPGKLSGDAPGRPRAMSGTNEAARRPRNYLRRRASCLVVWFSGSGEQPLHQCSSPGDCPMALAALEILRTRPDKCRGRFRARLNQTGPKSTTIFVTSVGSVKF